MLKDYALKLAQESIGKGEEEANNSGPFVEQVLWGLSEPPANWCAAFVCWCYYQATQKYSIENEKKIPWPFAYTLSARNLMNQFKSSKKKLSFHPGLTEIDKITPGDLMFFWRGSPTSWMGHVGIVEEIAANLIHTIEGNKGEFPSKVHRYYYPKGSVNSLLGFGKINI